VGGGKRLRPLLAYASAAWLGLPPERVDAIAVALEIVHAYSLVHDDLPALDDDPLRRGRPSTHVAFDEATAILVGDALQAHAYLVLATDGALDASPAARCQLVRDLATASGSSGMAGGQALDMEAAGRPADARAGRVHLWPEDRAAAGGRGPHALPAASGDRTAAGWKLRSDSVAPTAWRSSSRMTCATSTRPWRSAARPRAGTSGRARPRLLSLRGPQATRERIRALQAQARDALAGWGPEADLLRWLCATTLR
jgi:farnesyl diphosphate synthase